MVELSLEDRAQLKSRFGWTDEQIDQASPKILEACLKVNRGPPSVGFKVVAEVAEAHGCPLRLKRGDRYTFSRLVLNADECTAPICVYALAPIMPPNYILLNHLDVGKRPEELPPYVVDCGGRGPECHGVRHVTFRVYAEPSPWDLKAARGKGIGGYDRRPEPCGQPEPPREKAPPGEGLPEELREFAEKSAPRARGWKIVAEVESPSNCVYGLRMGDRFVFTPTGALLADESTANLCLWGLAPISLLPQPRILYDRLLEGRHPDEGVLPDHYQCFDVGVENCGWGKVVFKVYCVPEPWEPEEVLARRFKVKG